MSYENSVALVTGAASGIGRVTAQAFAAAGARLAICDVNEEGVQAFAEELRGQGTETLAMTVNVGVSSQVTALFEAIQAKWGRLDCAFNNAGVGGGGLPLLETDDESWMNCVQVNLSSVFYCMRAEIRMMTALGGGTIVNNCSVLGIKGGLGAAGAAYTATKHGVAGLTKNAAIAYGAQGVRVNAVCPGLISAGLGLKVLQRPPEQVATLISAQPLGRAGSSQEVADAVLWLCSPQSSYVTGHLLAVDGGFSAR
jgi:NAD(P)-dependent dehydrogenase (short-subunit alcohol dehydrogenase family)